MTNTQYAAHTNSTRRRWLQALASTPLVPTLTAPALAEGATKTKAHIVIAGSGLGGIAVANRLSKLLDGAKITMTLPRFHVQQKVGNFSCMENRDAK